MIKHNSINGPLMKHVQIHGKCTTTATRWLWLDYSAPGSNKNSLRIARDVTRIYNFAMSCDDGHAAAQTSKFNYVFRLTLQQYFFPDFLLLCRFLPLLSSSLHNRFSTLPPAAAATATATLTPSPLVLLNDSTNTEASIQ